MTLLGPVLLIVLVLLLLLAARCLRRLSDPHVVGPARRIWIRAGAALLTGLLTLLVYGVGLLSGFTRSATICAVRAGKAPSQRPSSITESFFPLSKECQWTDGTTVDLVGCVGENEERMSASVGNADGLKSLEMSARTRNGWRFRRLFDASTRGGLGARRGC